MKFFTKLILLLVGITIVPLIVITALFYWQMRDTISNQVNGQLISLANSKKQEINEVLNSYFNILKLTSSRTSLKTNLQDYSKNKDQQNLNKIYEIIRDASLVVSEIQSISVFDKENRLVVSTDSEIEKNKALWPLLQSPQEKEKYQGIFKDVDNIPRFLFTAPLILDNQNIGFIAVINFFDPVLKITSDFIGLGETGEMLIAQKNKEGDALFVTPTRFDPNASLTRIVTKDKINVPIVPATNGHETLLVENNIVDYKGTPVIAATRYALRADWGLVVKINRDEAYQPLKQLFNYFLIIFIITEISVLIISLLFSRWLINPLLYLSRVAQKLSQSDFDEVIFVASRYNRKDEMGFLIKVFNEMVVKLKESYENLEQKVEDRTKDLKRTRENLEQELEEVERLNKILSGRELKMIELKKKIEELEGKKINL
ncbi:MAG: diguanylate cyclase [Candidatus Magasanikbacteria bacterium GW2011_GWC2_40_17]|uniref:histidine kinase n=1 Tax=Candidatus Magasanikbacteria bacterium GW2011_GWA2_42_32 TaxID=1619039 RepID=A0A0G1CEY8_9BACT|nr:MAG: diguanylate cyclase [Candidatus Magasanikbacteria bacterium GW2011_GWC2_40_17]KKS57126.1 MAG: diguanylate cyclase [Candidatus Magasanikbacteria bacterium GW2011_GWA2_42_32]OGH85353.1 MAG: hypothetical protein A2294_01110 [Candidatus Magasanikbacteria bacterium RIFOXYB2_FULL_38_10]